MGLDDYEIITVVGIVSSLSYLWSIIDELLQSWGKWTRENSENALSMVHAIVTLLATDYTLSHLNPLTFNPANKTNVAEELGLMFSCSYFLYDTLRWKYRGPVSIVMLVHHISSILAIMNNLSAKNWGSHGNMALLVLEGSNPLLHLRRMLIGKGLRPNDAVYAVTEWCFLFSFLLFRFFIGIQYVLFIRNAKAPLYVIVSSYILLSISATFLLSILHVVKTKYLYMRNRVN